MQTRFTELLSTSHAATPPTRRCVLLLRLSRAGSLALPPCERTLGLPQQCHLVAGGTWALCHTARRQRASAAFASLDDTSDAARWSAAQRRMAVRTPPARGGSGVLCALLLACLVAPGAAPPPPGPPAAPAVNWASAALYGASATANSAGYWAGYAAEARYALDGDINTYWSSTGGAVRACASG